VESDASIRFGAADIQTNMGLLKEVRRRNPEAFVIYKPHPDVVAGLRVQGADECDANLYCDSVIEDVAMSDLLDGVDEIHTMTSLTGFEALLRGKRVVTYGMPFYAGWGLTDDLGMSKSVAARRDRTLKLDELVAGALILYPTYVSRHTGLLTTPETVLQELKEWRRKGAKQPRWAKSMLRWGLSFLKY
jgi:capsular polysaccharide export protein